ncbi:MAG TPA: RNB domain-containing ribonuclease [Steroidobacteraceae bacterium]|nr:RNB domain-containing ribonuclease [Steroidobacteraceae bacterium]
MKRIARRAMLDRGLLPDFSPEALAQANAITLPPLGQAGAGAPSAIRQGDSLTGSGGEQGGSPRDLRALLWASIDNDDSLDLDQLTVAEPLAGGAVKILVAVADVSGTVGIGSPIDDHARINTTSVYTAAQIFPMLPERLSTDLTSLADGADRSAYVIEMTIDAGGDLKGSDIYRALVRNRAKLAYNSVAAWLDGKAPPPRRLAAVPGMEEQIRIQDEVARALKRVRRARGSLTLETLEGRPVFESGVLSDLRPDERNRAKDLIEDFMVAANGVTARFLEGNGFPSIRRILRTPERWPRIVTLARQAGERLPLTPDAVALSAFLARRLEVDPVHFPDLSLSVVKLLGRGEYAFKLPGQEIPGHFGLAVSDYTHSTAPNRRFPDLITQRLLKAVLAGGRLPYTSDELQALARHCTDQESSAAKVERAVRKSAAALLLRPRIGERFDAIVTGATDKGTWVRIQEPVAEGRVVRGYEGLDVGDRVRVELVHTDPARGFIDFARSRRAS